ncbi:MAG: hypothetical protein H6899_06080 [Rhodobacter sp.]|nr:hypothetical protein [Paracoccaceae bacterium]MCB1410042.1 hypothetical protein [Paracoccaceae bacterium]MCC0079508.1 hypothetical protein [Rhodobacter sp.]
MSQHTTIRPASAVKALVVATLAGAAFGASSALLPFLKLNAIVLLGGVTISFVVHLALQRGMLANLAVGLVSAALAVFAMWALWFGLEHGFATLASVLAQGPKGIRATLETLGASARVSVRLSGGTRTTHGPEDMRLFWLIETVLMAAGPIFGALLSPLLQRRQSAVA